MEPWQVKSHIITAIDAVTANWVIVTGAGGTHRWFRKIGVNNDEYQESGSGDVSDFRDPFGVDVPDTVVLQPNSPSRPMSEDYQLEAPGRGDDFFIDVIFYTP